MIKKFSYLPIFLVFLILTFELSLTFCKFNSFPNYNPESQEQNFSTKQRNLKLAQSSENFSCYNLTLTFNEETASVQGNLTVNFYNNDPKNFTQLPFHLYLSGMSYDLNQGSIEILNIFDYENNSEHLYYEAYPNQQIMWVNLLKELKEEERVKFIIEFNATLPDGPYDRANVYGEDFNHSKIYKFTGFYPIPCVYDEEDGWNIDPYLDQGDPFYFDMAYYNIFITIPNETVIAATGQMQERKTIGATTFYHFNPISPVREITFSISRHFLVESKLVNGVNLSTFYLPKSSLLWAGQALNNAECALLLYNSTFGRYPYPTLNIVEEYSSFWGMEYPCQIYASEAVDLLWENSKILEKIIAHETCHQWWYNLVGNDEVDLPFLDEGIVVWATDFYGEHYYGSWEYFQFTRYIDRVRSYYYTEGLSSKINQSVYESNDWVYIGYYKAPLVLEKLRQTIGHNNFLNGLKLLFERYKYKHILLSDMQACFEEVLGTSLDWYFFPWFDNPYLPKYAFYEIVFNSKTNQLNITIEDRNTPLNQYEYRQLVPLAIYNNIGGMIYYDEIWINGTSFCTINLSATPHKVSLLYNNYILVQLEDPFKLSLDSYIDLPLPFIPGYNLSTILLISICLLGLLAIFTRKKLL